MDERTYDLTTFSLTEMAECAAALRRCGDHATSMEAAADAITTFLRHRLVDADGGPAGALIRVFVTTSLDRLEPQLREEAFAVEPAAEPSTECLTLLASAGDESTWNDRRASAGHRVIPLASTAMVQRMPMVAGLIEGLGLDVDAVVGGRAGLHRGETFGVFHVAEAVGSPQIPAQDFVAKHGIRSALGFGGLLPSGHLFAVVLFSTVPVPDEVAELFHPIGVSVRLALLPFDSGAWFDSDDISGPGPRDMRAEALAYAQLLEAFESTATTQANRLEIALRTSHLHQERVEAEARVIETLHYVGTALAGRLDLGSIVDVATEAATTVTGAQFGAFFYNNVSAAGESYLLYKIAGVPRERFSQFPMPRNTEVFDPTFRGEAPVRSDDITRDPRFGHNAPYYGLPAGHLPVRSYLAVPVVSRSGEVLGGIFLGHEDVGVFDTRDERLVVGIASQASTAIDTARLYDAEREARFAAERTADQLASLQRSTAALASARSVQEAAEIVVTAGSVGVGATRAALYLARNGNALVPVATHGIDTLTSDDVRSPLPSARSLGETIAAGAPLFVGRRDELVERYPDVGGDDGCSACAVLPFTAAADHHGAIVFAWPGERGFTPEDRQFMLALGSQCSQALDRAVLSEADERKARQQLFLSEASRELAATLDPTETQSKAVRLCIGVLADHASLHILDADGLRLSAAAAGDPDLDDHLARILGDEPIPTTDTRLIAIVNGDGAVRIDPLDPASLELSTGIDRSWAIPGDRPLAAMAVPLEARTICYGVLTVARSESYDDSDLTLLRDLASRIAVALDNARLHRDRSETAVLLQRSLLPPHLTGIPGMDLDVRYRALAQGNELGGDFYDVFRIGPGRWGAVIGDVCGKGVAAASLTALARFTARAAALGGADVVDVLSVVNRAVVDEGVEDRFCTMIALVVEPGHDDGAHVRMAIGGHPLPLIVGPDTSVRSVGRAGMAVGLFEGPRWASDEFVLRPGESLVLYTDGVTEARSPDGEFAPELLAEALAGIDDLTATNIVERVESEVLAFEHGEQRDDIAILAMRCVGQPHLTDSGVSEFDRRFPPMAASVPMARHEISGWLAVGGDGPASIADELLLVVTELATNSMRAARSGFQIRAWFEADSVVLELTDDGTGFDQRRVPDHGQVPELMAERGRGLFLLRELMDDLIIESNESGTVVRARKRFSP